MFGAPNKGLLFYNLTQTVMKKIYSMRFMLSCFLLVTGMAWAQERAVSGKVTSIEDGSVIPGVNVVLKGTTNGTTTDAQGSYKMNIPSSGGTLVFSFIGLKSEEVAIGERTIVDISLGLDITQLTEVVVTAVGIQRDAKALGYAVKTVKADQLTQKSEPDVLRSMQGKVAGVAITGSGGIAGGSTRITMRGINSFQGNNQPLFVVDGVPYDNTLNNSSSTGSTSNLNTSGAQASSRIADLDPNNIASVTTLNGAAAAALYGTRAANGVIVITTKAGSSRASKKGLEVNYNTSYSMEKIANLPDYQNTYSTGSQSVFAHANGTWGPKFSLRDSIPFYPGYVEAFPAQYGVNGSTSVGITTPHQAYPGNVENFFKTGSIYENSLTISGGNEKAGLTAVISNMKQDGFIPNSDFRRTNFSIGGNSTLSNGVIMGGSLQYTNSEQNGPLVGSGGQSPFSRLLFQPRNWPLQDMPYINPTTGKSVYFFGFSSGVDNPYWSVYNNLFSSKVDRIATSFNIGKDITDWLNVTYKVGYNTYNDRRNQTINKGSAAGAQSLGSVTLDNIYFGELESNFLINFNKDINEDISLKALIGHNYNQRTNDRQSITSLGIISNNIFDLDNVATVQPNGGTYNQRKLWAVFGDVTAGYKDYAFLNATIRNDHSSTLPSNNRSFFYYGTTLSLILTDIFDIKSNFLNSAKIRGGVSRVGRDANPYQLFNTINVLNNDGFGVTTFPFNGQPGATVPNTSFNPQLKPEFTDEFEVGTNLELFNGKLSADITYYNRLTTNQISAQSVPSASGFSAVYNNFGAIRNSGWEINLNGTPLELSNGFRWNINAAFTRNKNEVEKLTDGVTEIIIDTQGGVTAVARPGLAFGAFRGTVPVRDGEGKDAALLIDPATGLLITNTEQEIIGNPNPKFLLGVTNTFSWKGITVSALLDLKYGGDLFSQTTAFLIGRGTTKDTEGRDLPHVVPGVWGNPNNLQPLTDAGGNRIVNTIQVMDNNLYFQSTGGSFAINAPLSYSIFDATTIRLREISVGYDLPKSLLQKTPFGNVNLSLSGRNLWYLAPYFPKYTHFDPEVSSGQAGNAQGFDVNAAPTTKRVGVNLRITF
jgi:TonB-linked SusC/RagA family outer membrane protein